MKLNKILLLSLFALSFAACNNDTATPEANTAAAPAATKAQELTTTDGATEVKEVVGIAECDEYINKYQHCIDTKMTAEAQALASKSLKQMSEEWRAAATSQEAKNALARACKQAHAAAKASLTDFHCEW